MKLLWLFVSMAFLAAGNGLADEQCTDCHRAAITEFSQTMMANAATTPGFQSEANENKNPEACFGCHGPSGGSGLTCIDCHQGGGHPYGAVLIPDVCARCHDSPGEATVRTFRTSLAARLGKTCLDCHLTEGKGSHSFRGASDPAFLRGTAQVRLMISEGNLLAAIRHNAGHSMPGGTTGRAVWLVLRGIGADGAQVWEESHRFGWLTDGRNWQDHTLAPDRSGIVEVKAPEKNGAVAVEARLLYSRMVTTGPQGEEISRATMTLR